ncbi:hypothetical protein J6590_063638 [Homalodisca vitripennis]|nr:hypothetical protein J6590_063638 [Homalodisca vitripennis]
MSCRQVGSIRLPQWPTSFMLSSDALQLDRTGLMPPKFIVGLLNSVMMSPQRELAREKNQKKQQEINKKKAANDKNSNKGMTLEQRKQRDADMMRMKQQKAMQKEGTVS